MHQAGDVKKHLTDPTNQNSLFQVASQFNLLEMASPAMTPERGVDIYYNDPTQGPACSVCAIGATLYRNYFVPIGNREGQTRDNQINCLAPILNRLLIGSSKPFKWTFQNGYIFMTNEDFKIINEVLKELKKEEKEELKSLLEVGIHWNVEVNDNSEPLGHFVSQIFCSAYPVGYNRVDLNLTRPLSVLIQEATQEATVIAGILNKQATGNGNVIFSKVGGGVFRNEHSWIAGAIEKAAKKFPNFGLNLKLFHYRTSESEYNSIRI